MENLDYGVIGNCRSAALISKRDLLIGAVCLILIHRQYLPHFLMQKKGVPSTLK